MRLFKEPAELDLMRRAAEISREAHAAAAALAREGPASTSSRPLDYAFRRRGGWGPAYESIVGGGANATVLHYVPTTSRCATATLVLIDAGCELQGYAADVTRTYPVGGRFGGARPARSTTWCWRRRRRRSSVSRPAPPCPRTSTTPRCAAWSRA
jgi:Xaa-Pro aminopeptidase